MKTEIREILSKYRQNRGYKMDQAERDLLDLFSKTIKNRKVWKSVKYGIEVEADCKTEAVLKINKVLNHIGWQQRVGMNDAYLLNPQSDDIR